MTYMTKAGLLEKSAGRTYVATARGRDFLNKFPDHFGIKELLVIPEFAAFQRPAHTTVTADTSLVEIAEPSLAGVGTPHERMMQH